MSHALHVFRKDVRRLRWAIAAWIAVVVGLQVLKIAGPGLSFDSLGLQIVMATLSELLMLIEILALALIVSALVHDEPLVGADAFWLTRPIGARALLAAKVSFAALFLIVSPTVADATAVAVMSGNMPLALRAVPAFALTQTLWVSLLIALAALTPSLTRFVLTLVGGIAAVTVGLSLFTTVVILTASEDSSGYPPSMLSDPTSGVVLTMLVTCAAFVVIAYQYRNRRAGRAAAIGAIGLICAVAIADVWPWHFARPAEPDPGSWAGDAAGTPAALDTAVAPQAWSEAGIGRTASRRFVAAPVRLMGMPPTYAAESTGIRARVAYPDGAILESATARGIGVQLPEDGPSDRTRRLQSALGSSRIVSYDDGRRGMWPTVLSVGDREYERYGTIPGHLTATVDFFLSRSRLVGAMPVAARATMQAGSSGFELLRVVRRPDGYTVLLRRTDVRPFSRPAIPKQYEFVLRNAARGEAVFGDVQPASNPGLHASWFLLGGFTVETGGTAVGFDLVDMIGQFPSRGLVTAARPIDAVWLDEADLAVIETVYAGRVTRTLTVDGFRMR
jgi:hypothetical protein